MKSVQEIKDKIKEGFPTDFFGFATGDLVYALPYEAAKDYLEEDFIAKENAKEEYEKQATLTDEAVIGKIIDYIPFAQEKIDCERGLSADRSCQHFITWFWLIDEAFSKMLRNLYVYHYAPYGQPLLDEVKNYISKKENK